jgi:transposase InsO family protein
VVDTGAEVTVLRESTSRRLKLKCYSPTKLLSAANGTDIGLVGESNVHISNNGTSIRANVFVSHKANSNLLGRPQIEALRLLRYVNHIREDKFDPFTQYPKLFEGLGVMPGEFKIRLRPGTEPVRLCAPRPIAAGLRDKAKLEINRMLGLDVIEPVENPTEWCSGLTIAPKPNGAIRMCVDLTQLNKGVKRELYPFPRVSDMLSRLSEGRVFSKLDANSGFWQVKLEPESRQYTTFITPWGRYCFKRMPFGISSAPEFYQRAMERILDGLEGVICFMDDVLVFGSSAEQHWARLRSVLNRISNSGVTLKREKCEFGSDKVKFLGHVVSQKGIEPDPDKVSAITEMQPPTCKKEARRLMGMVNYLSKFSMNLAKYSKPIYAVLGAKCEWYWDTEQQDAFERIKAELSGAPVLCAFDLKRKHRVSADASKAAVGAVLLQQSDSGDWQPVEYASRKMTEAECRYAMIEKESLAITWACEKFDYYLVGRTFEIETDHRPLVTLLGEKDFSKLPLRVQKFKLRLMRYNYSIFHTPGHKMYLADSLSRPFGTEASPTKRERSDSVVNYVRSNLLSTSEIREVELLESLNDDTLSKITTGYLRNGWPPTSPEGAGELASLYHNRDKLTLCSDFIMYGVRFYIPKPLRPIYLERVHEGHQGINKCYSRAQQLFWWPSITKDITDYISKCNVCIKNSRVKHQPWTEGELPDSPWREVGADVFEFDGKLYLILVDYYSKWIECVAMNFQTTEAVSEAMKVVFSRLGVPVIVRSDNGPCFASSRFKEFADRCGFRHVTSSPRYPQSNGLAERSVGLVKGLWRKSSSKNNALFAYRSTPLKYSKYSPGDLMFGRTMRSPLGLTGTPKKVDYRQFRRDALSYQRDVRSKWDANHKVQALPELNGGALVWVKAPGEEGVEGTVTRADPNPESLWVRIERTGKEVRRNRKHLFPLTPSDCSDEHGDTMFLPEEEGKVVPARLPVQPSADGSDTANTPANPDRASNPVDVPTRGDNPVESDTAAPAVSDPASDNAVVRPRGRVPNAPNPAVQAPTSEPDDPPRVSSFGRPIRSTRNKDYLY